MGYPDKCVKIDMDKVLEALDSIEKADKSYFWKATKYYGVINYIIGSYDGYSTEIKELLKGENDG